MVAGISGDAGCGCAAALPVRVAALYGPRALVSPVNESLWEHVKIVFYPLAAGAFWMARGDRASRAAWLLSAVIVSLAMPGSGLCIPHSAGRHGHGLRPDAVRPVHSGGLPAAPGTVAGGQSAGGRALAWVLALAMTAALVWFTFAPPDCVLFYDLSNAARTFHTIPV